MWCLLILLLVVPKANRCWQSWTILLPLPVILIIGGILARLLSIPHGINQILSWPFATLAMAWIALWMIGPVFCRPRPASALLLAIGAMLVIADVSYIAHFGPALSGEFILVWCLFGISTCALLVGMALSARSCHQVYSFKRFMTYLLLWIALGLVVLVGVPGSAAAAFMAAAGIDDWPEIALAAAVATLILTAAIYLVNLPVMIVAFYCPTYRERFHSVFRLPTANEQTGVAGASHEERS